MECNVVDSRTVAIAQFWTNEGKRGDGRTDGLREEEATEEEEKAAV